MAAKRRTRAPDKTRERLLAAAFEEMYRNGYQAAGLKTILTKAGVTSGALYHHFPNKLALGMAVVDEVIRQPILEAYLGPIEAAEGDPLAAMQQVLRRRADDFAETGIDCGCPLNNLVQEMSPLDDRFRRQLEAVLETWVAGLAAALDRAKGMGTVRGEVDSMRVARMVVAAVEGSFGMAKTSRSVKLLRANLETIAEFLETLRPVA